MGRQRIVLRSYEESFEPGKVKVISELIDDLDELGDSFTYKLYTSEIQRCLSAGLLLAAVSVSTSLLELFVRDLSVAQRILLRHGGDMKLKGRVERELEEDRQAGFHTMLEALQPTVTTSEDTASLREFYNQTRIPLAHALVRRLVSPHNQVGDEIDDLLGFSHRSLEDRFEDGAIDEVRFVVQIIKKYRPWLLRRYRTAGG